MRGIYYTGIFLIVAAMAAIILLIIFPQAFPQNVAATFAAITGAPADSESKDRPSPFEEKKEEPAKKKTSASLQQSQARVPEIDVWVAPVEAPPALDPPRRFPLAQEIAKGMTRSTILAAFGTPQATVVGSDGLLRERLVYVDKNSGRKTFISLANGTVYGAETLPQ